MEKEQRHSLICKIIDKLEKDYGHDFHGIRSEVYSDMGEIIDEVCLVKLDQLK